MKTPVVTTCQSNSVRRVPPGVTQPPLSASSDSPADRDAVRQYGKTRPRTESSVVEERLLPYNPQAVNNFL
jgi:hypothetical protein